MGSKCGVRVAVYTVSMEKMPTTLPVTEPPVPEGIESAESRETVYDRIESLQLEYCARVWERKIPPLPGVDLNSTSFAEFIDTYSSIGSQIAMLFKERTGKYASEAPELADDFRNKAFSAIEKLHAASPDSWVHNIRETLAGLAQELPIGEEQALEEDVAQDGMDDGAYARSSGPFYAGIFHYGIYKGSKTLEKYGITPDDTFVEVHIEALAEQDTATAAGSRISLKDSLAELAKSIHEHAPGAKLLIAKSWLMDTPLAGRLGFTVDPEPLPVGQTMGFWGQFVQQDGEINRKRSEQFMQTGVAEYNTLYGYMSVEDLLETYSSREG